MWAKSAYENSESIHWFLAPISLNYLMTFGRYGIVFHKHMIESQFSAYQIRQVMG